MRLFCNDLLLCIFIPEINVLNLLHIYLQIFVLFSRKDTVMWSTQPQLFLGSNPDPDFLRISFFGQGLDPDQLKKIKDKVSIGI